MVRRGKDMYVKLYNSCFISDGVFFIATIPPGCQEIAVPELVGLSSKPEILATNQPARGWVNRFSHKVHEAKKCMIRAASSREGGGEVEDPVFGVSGIPEGPLSTPWPQHKLPYHPDLAASEDDAIWHAGKE